MYRITGKSVHLNDSNKQSWNFFWKKSSTRQNDESSELHGKFYLHLFSTKYVRIDNYRDRKKALLFYESR